jgi:hypothetical protein
VAKAIIRNWVAAERPEGFVRQVLGRELGLGHPPLEALIEQMILRKQSLFGPDLRWQWRCRRGARLASVPIVILVALH